MTYYLYHIPGKKIGITKDLKKRVEEQQGYNEGEYEIMLQTDDIIIASELEIEFQKAFGYRVDETPYNELKFNKKENEMNINITEATTTFPCPANKLKGRLMDNLGMSWETDHGKCVLAPMSIEWIMQNIQTSRYNSERCYVYNKAFSRWFDNNDPHTSHDELGGNLADVHMRERYPDQYNGKTRSGGLLNDMEYECCDKDNPCVCKTNYSSVDFTSQFDLIRDWAEERGLYDNGDTKTQALKLVEEVGETCRAILKEDYEEVTDGIGDCVVVLTNLAELHGVSIEECVEKAYDEIKNRKGMMANGTYVKQ